jgi:hypothetical protein
MNIGPVVTGIPARTINELRILVSSFSTEDSTLQLIYQLLEDGSLVSTGVFNLDETQFNTWAGSNAYLNGLIVAFLGVTPE